ncbi:MAG: tRNA (guanosine(37)-N1)-methyltransferase TrmD [Caldilineaceae bacterium]|nr:tRNA (guanosine(37)-N1)-methyltransferase TrmD [Caldilineaceae bacterium]
MNSENFNIQEPSAVVHFDVFTLFPQMFSGPFAESIIKRAQENNLMTVAFHDVRNYTTDRHHICDDTPYGGGGGMVMKPEPIFRSVETVLSRPRGWTLPTQDAYVNLPPWNAEEAVPLPANAPVILLSPQGRLLTQSVVAELAQFPRLALICGRYEGVDERVRSQLITDEISIGDYVLSGGELAAMVIVDAVTRLIPGALGYALGAHQDSHSPGLGGLLEGPQYTRPPIFRGEAVPDVLLSGHHAKVAAWRHEQALLQTLQQRPDLLLTLPLTKEDRAFLRKWGWHDEVEPEGSEGE